MRLLSILLVLLLCSQFPICSAAQTSQVELDIHTLLNAPHGMYSSPNIKQAHDRLIASPDEYIDFIEPKLVFPNNESLLDYPNFLAKGDHTNLLLLLQVAGNEDARAIIRQVYYETAEDHTILNTQFRELLLPENKPSTRTEEYMRLESATGAAWSLHIMTLDILGNLKDPAILQHAIDRHQSEHYSVKPFIEGYCIAITGSFPPPASYFENN